MHVLVDTKNGDTFHGELVACDTFMNLQLAQVTITSEPLQKQSANEAPCFHSCPVVFVRGNNIKTVQFDSEVLQRHSEQVKLRQAEALEHKANKR